ncbi:uncharacterized protein N7515_005769 [Penicillium bovifimosum]|uniref:Uncharacterized protein n=1 Tax=Penicillium bovifimosum TaxID=126998 RepID=A0A9W9GTF1_9EURO|nr:uncharacterized protein N7515_005769 [Penicillium bovifimosum]KAJ5129730.1 hypothetical protein N7515_005769 [Penicillium bovifimosum]
MQPVTNGQFSFNVDTFYVAASGGQVHRRAAPTEIKALYDTGSATNAPDHPGHWYEAQLLHYGLPSSKVKSTAKMRLLKALQERKLRVPKEHVQIEKDLKKQWKNQGEQLPANTKNTTTKAVTTKTTTVSKTVMSKATEIKAAASKAAAKTAATKAPAAPKAAAPKAAAPKAAAPKAAPKGTVPRATAPQAAESQAAAPQAAAPEATAYATAEAATPKPAPVKRKRAEDEEETFSRPQTARRSLPADRTQATTHAISQPMVWRGQVYADAPPSYESDCETSGSTSHDFYDDDPYDDRMDIDDASEPYGRPSPSPPRFPPRIKSTSLGLINGTYEIQSPDIEGQWPHYIPYEGLELTIRLNGKEVWGSYHFGIFGGVFWMLHRPMKASTEEIPFEWRGREMGTGEMSFGSSNQGYIMFLGDGKIAGSINCMGNLGFQGEKVGSEVQTASQLEYEWGGYNQEEYDRENRARWR